MNNLKKLKCPVFNKCGGCNKQTDYTQQLKEKHEFVSKLLSGLVKVEDILGMENPYHYRNKVHAVFDTDKNGNIVSGVYEEGSHRVVPVEKCLIEDEKADEIIFSIRKLLRSFKIKTYNEDTKNGLLRHVLIRKGYVSGEIMVVLVLSSHIFPHKNNFIKALLSLHPEITTIVLNVNNKRTSMVLGDKQIALYGNGYIEDTLLGNVFRISPRSFYQVNSVQTEVLYMKAIELAELKGTETIIDAYCGIGTIGIVASKYVNEVIGVELNRDAFKDAEINKKVNGIKNTFFYNMDAGEFMLEMSRNKKSVDVVFMDPPRSGSDERFLDALCAIKPAKVIYISCNPVTLKRDLEYLSNKGYDIIRAVPVDMFPYTEHVECVALMSRVEKYD